MYSSEEKVKKINSIICIIAAAAFMSACGTQTETVAVESVADIVGLGSTGLAERFAGVVTSEKEVNVAAASGKTVSEVKVEVGDTVSAGDVLFTYDMDLSQLNLDKAELELKQMKASLAAKQEEKSTLERERENVSASAKMAYTLQIEECATEITEMNYNISIKETEVKNLEETVSISDCTSPIDGRVKSIGEDASAENYIVIVSTGSYTVRGYVNENNVNALSTGMEVLIRSRVDDKTWNGYIDSVDLSSPTTTAMYYYSSDSDTTTSSKYPFYVDLDDNEGLMLGQHVYIEPAIEGASEDESIISLPSYYLFDIDGENGYVWAENANGKLEKRQVTLSDYNAETDTYPITDGLEAEDNIAFPQDDLKEGMTCVSYDAIDDQSGQDGSDIDLYNDEDGNAEVVY